MYLFIYEDGHITKGKTITEAHQENVNDGLLEIIDTVELTRLADDSDWEDIELDEVIEAEDADDMDFDDIM